MHYRNKLNANAPVTEASQWLGEVEASVPYDGEAEVRALSAMLQQPKYIQQMKPDDFHHPDHQKFYCVLVGIDIEGAEISPASVREELKQRQLVERMEGLFDRVTAEPELTKTEIKVALQILKSVARLRAAMRFGYDLVNRAPSMTGGGLHNFVRKGAKKLCWSNWRLGTSPE